MAYEESYLKYSTDNIFTGAIDRDGTIYQANMRNKTKIGIDSEREQELLNQMSEMQATLDNYYGKLVELGEIKVPKSAEEIAAEQLRMAQEQAEQQAMINQQLLEAIGSLNAEVRELKGVTENGMDRQYTGTSGNAIGSDSEINRAKPAASKSRNTTRKKVDSANNEQS